MADALTVDYIKQKAFELLPISIDALYDTQFDILISGAINKLRSEGIDYLAVDKEGELIFTQGSFEGLEYCICVSYQLLKDIDLDTDMNFMTEQYITRVNTLRCSITPRLH